MLGAVPHILVVDDEKTALKTIEYFLKKSNYEVTLAENGEEAIKIAENKNFDLIISDLNMPLMNGNDLVRRLRLMPEYKLTPFLFLSGNTEYETWIQNLNDGADDFMTKPFNDKVLISKINAYLKKSQLRKESNKQNQSKNLSLENGIILYCSQNENNNLFDLQEIKTELYSVTSAEELFKFTEKSNIWLIIIDENTNWANEILTKITSIAGSSCCISLLISEKLPEDRIDHYLKNGVNQFIKKYSNPQLISSQINSIVNHEEIVRSKYFDSLNLAARQSPIRFENRIEKSLKNITVSLVHEPYDKLPGGDFYEFFLFENEINLIVLGDVMGKKWGAWFFVLAYIGYIRSMINFFTLNGEINFSKNPEKLLELLNRYIYKDLQFSEVFTTLSIIVVDPQNNKILISSAGAIRPVYFNASENQVQQLNIIGTLLGVIETTKYQRINLNFNRGDKLLFFTDGYSEAMNSNNNQMVGEEDILRIFEKLGKTENLNAAKVEEELITFSNIKSFDDDRTLLLIS